MDISPTVITVPDKGERFELENDPIMRRAVNIIIDYKNTPGWKPTEAGELPKFAPVFGSNIWFRT